MAQTKTKVPVEKVKLSVAQVLKDLDNGITRPQIREKYGLNSQGLKQLFQDPRLKGKKVKPAPNFILVDENGNPENPEAITGTASTTAPQAEAKAAVAEDTKGSW